MSFLHAGTPTAFGRKLFKRLGLTGQLPNPFAELADTDLEVFKVITLTLTLGLRRGEIDKIEYDAFNLEAAHWRLRAPSTCMLKAHVPQAWSSLSRRWFR